MVPCRLLSLSCKEETASSRLARFWSCSPACSSGRLLTDWHAVGGTYLRGGRGLGRGVDLQPEADQLAALLPDGERRSGLQAVQSWPAPQHSAYNLAMLVSSRVTNLLPKARSGSSRFCTEGRRPRQRWKMWRNLLSTSSDSGQQTASSSLPNTLFWCLSSSFQRLNLCIQTLQCGDRGLPGRRGGPGCTGPPPSLDTDPAAGPACRSSSRS